MKLLLISLGCDKNLVDSEMMITALREDGFELVDDEEAAEVIVVNTCCFIGDAKEESINTLLEMAEYKETGRCRLLVAAGCLAQRYHDEIKSEIPEVDVIVGTMGYEELGTAIRQAMQEGGVVESLKDINYLPEPRTDRENSTGGCYAYLKIAEGCDKCCSYCVIPKVRGHYRSIPMENLIAQARHLAESGVKELILVAQETTLYGTDLYGEKRLPELLERLSDVEEVCWIRILYCYPEEITPELVEAIKKLPKVCHYLDIPVQHGADTVLRRMGRRTDQARLIEVIEYLRKEIPDIVLRTTLITGFPGETQEEFEELREFVRRMRFERLGVFPYSQEEDTLAAQMPDQIEEEIKQQRRDEIMSLQQQISFDHGQSRVGEKITVMIEGYLPEDDVYEGRTYMDAPEVDGYVFLQTEERVTTGDFVRATIIRAEEYDMIAVQGDTVSLEEEDNEFAK